MATTIHIIMTWWFLVLILMLASSSATTTTINNATTGLVRATEEMQKANYFTFVLLINLAPPQLLQGNLTFLMPKDKTLSGNTMKRQSSVADFLLRHSIPSPLLFEHLQRFPTGSILPTSKPGLFLNITKNGGRRCFFLNNVRITRPNICTSGSSIRCHGIDGLIQSLKMPAIPRHNIPPPSPGAFAEAPTTATPSRPTVIGTPSPSNSSQPQKSGCQPQQMIKSHKFSTLKTLTACLLMFIAMKLSM